MLIEVEVTEVVIRAIPTGGADLKLCIDIVDEDYWRLRAAAPGRDVQALVKDMVHQRLRAVFEAELGSGCR